MDGVCAQIEERRQWLIFFRDSAGHEFKAVNLRNLNPGLESFDSWIFSLDQDGCNRAKI